MKTKLKIMLSLLTVTFTANAFAEDAHSEDIIVEPGEEEEGEGHMFALLVNPVDAILAPILSEVAVAKPELQFRLHDYVGLSVEPRYGYHFGAAREGVDVHAFGGNIGLRVVPGGGGLQGTYIVPRFGAFYATGEGNGESLDATVINPSMEVGYGWAWGNFVMNAGGGLGYSFVVDGHDIYQDSPVGGLNILANFSIGFGI